MSEILGYDCNGKELRAGDRVVIVRVLNPAYSHLNGVTCSIIGASSHFPGRIEVNIRTISKTRWLAGIPSAMRRIGSDGSKAGSWERIRRLTDWSPERETA